MSHHLNQPAQLTHVRQSSIPSIFRPFAEQSVAMALAARSVRAVRPTILAHNAVRLRTDHRIVTGFAVTVVLCITGGSAAAGEATAGAGVRSPAQAVARVQRHGRARRGGRHGAADLLRDAQRAGAGGHR